MRKIFSLPILLLIFIVFFFFRPFFLESKLPIPADTIIGLYHPFRDLYVKDYPNGIPYKNFLITDPVRQQYPWKELAVSTEKLGVLPLWNPYSFAGTPLLGALQSGALYPLNGLLLALPFALGWSVFIMSQPILAGLFFYLYVRNLRQHPLASLLGAIVFAFCGFSIAWMEWGNILHTALWLPLILLSVDKIFAGYQKNLKNKNYLWHVAFVLSLTCSLLAGHLQIFFYVLLVSVAHFLGRWWQFGKSKKLLLVFSLLGFLAALITFVQWFPLLQFILQSGRDVDQLNSQKIEGWFIPWQHLIQFIAPDFFGNPTTLNYWGTWNYGELIGYAGLVPFMLAIFAMVARRDKKTLAFSLLFSFSLLFALPTIFAQLPYLWHIPFLATSQPTRLLFLTDFSLAVLAVLGSDFLLRQHQKKALYLPIGILLVVFGCLWFFIINGYTSFPQVTLEQLATAKRNLMLPTALFGITGVILVLFSWRRMPQWGRVGLVCVLLCLTLFDLLRFGEKFTPFTDKAYLFPQTKTIAFLQKDKDQFRIMTTDSRILPPNFSTVYRLQSVDGYDPLYLRRYAEFIAASERTKPDIKPPFGFNRIITPRNYDSRLIDLLGVRYVLSLSEITSPKFEKVSTEGQTIVYKNKEAFPRAFFVREIKSVTDKQSAMNALFDTRIDLHKTAIVEGLATNAIITPLAVGKVTIASYQDNEIHLTTNNAKAGFLVLTDSYYSTWHAAVCSAQETECKDTEIYLTNYQFRGILVPAGKHHIIFANSLL